MTTPLRTTTLSLLFFIALPIRGIHRTSAAPSDFPLAAANESPILYSRLPLGQTAEMRDAPEADRVLTRTTRCRNLDTDRLNAKDSADLEGTSKSGPQSQRSSFHQPAARIERPHPPDQICSCRVATVEQDDESLLKSAASAREKASLHAPQ